MKFVANGLKGTVSQFFFVQTTNQEELIKRSHACFEMDQLLKTAAFGWEETCVVEKQIVVDREGKVRKQAASWIVLCDILSI